jgi:hypothetical protein
MSVASVAATAVPRKPRKTVAEPSFEDSIKSAYGQGAMKREPGGKLLRSTQMGEPPPNPEQQGFKFKALLAQIFLCLEVEDYNEWSSRVSAVVKLVIVFAIGSYIVSTVNSCTYTPDMCDEPVCNNDPVLCPGYMMCEPVPVPIFDYIEVACVYFFSAEYFLRVLTCWTVSPRIARVLPANWKVEHGWDDPQPKYPPYLFIPKYMLRIPNIIDLLAIAPYYFSLVQGKGGGGSFARVLRLFRLVRVLRLLKALTFLKNVDVTISMIAMTMRNASQVLFVFLFFVLIIILLFGCLMFMAEQGTYTVNNDYPLGAYLRPNPDKTGVEVTPFDSIPTAMYWVVINLGDLVPTTDAGRCLSCIVQLVQIFGTAFPVGVIAMEFDSAYKGACSLPPLVSCCCSY